QLEGDRVRRPVLRIALEDIRAHGRENDVEKPAQNAVFVQALDLGQRPLDASPRGVRARLARLHIESEGRIKSDVKQLEQIAGHSGMAEQGIGYIARPERRTDLA